jgi:hypothetical protein
VYQEFRHRIATRDWVGRRNRRRGAKEGAKVLVDGRNAVEWPHPWLIFRLPDEEDNLFGYLQGQGCDAVEFYTDKKVAVERWVKEHPRKC